MTALLAYTLNYFSTIEYMLRKGIRQKQLAPYVQPIVNATTGKIIGGEVLIRWEHPRFGMIPPDKFIAVAEQTDLIIDLTSYTFNQVEEQFSKNKQFLPQDLFICFNASSLNFQTDGIVKLCVEFINDLSDINTTVVIEITERQSIDNNLKTNSVIKRLHDSGVHFSLDDFGTGNANYSYLKQFRPKYIKIDKMFTDNISCDHASILLVKNMISLAHKFDCLIIAEGVENQTQVKILQMLGVDYFQGFYYSRPVPIAEYIELLQSI